MLWPRKGSLMKTQTWILDNRLHYTRKIELHRKGKKSCTVQITPILICLLVAKSLVLITVRRVHYGKMGKAPTIVERWHKVVERVFTISCWVLDIQSIREDRSFQWRLTCLQNAIGKATGFRSVSRHCWGQKGFSLYTTLTLPPCGH